LEPVEKNGKQQKIVAQALCKVVMCEGQGWPRWLTPAVLGELRVCMSPLSTADMVRLSINRSVFFHQSVSHRKTVLLSLYPSVMADGVESTVADLK